MIGNKIGKSNKSTDLLSLPHRRRWNLCGACNTYCEITLENTCSNCGAKYDM